MQTDKGMTNEWPKKFKSAAINLKKKEKKSKNNKDEDHN